MPQRHPCPRPRRVFADRPHRMTVGAALLGALLLAVPAGAADQTIRGQRFTATSSAPDDPARRRVVIVAREIRSPDTLTGDPTVSGSNGGGVLQVITSGANPATQVFALPQGEAASGKPFWRAVKDGFRYTDQRGENGPVQSVVVRKAGNGTFATRIVISGRKGPLDIAPPAPGTSAAATLVLSGGDRYCVAFGPDAIVKNSGGRSFSVFRITAEGCPATVSGELLALTYNVAGLPEGISGSHPAVNTPQISPLLNGYDLVVAQETWQTPDPNPLAPLRVYHELLVADALHPYKSIPATQPLGSDPGRPSALLADGLNRMSRFPFTEVVRQRWNQCHPSSADCLALKGFSMARTTLAPGVEVDVYNLHMEAGGDPEDDAIRDQSVSQLRDFMSAFSPGRAVIVGGDFNLHTTSEPDQSQYARLLAETGLVDVCAALGCPDPGRIDKLAFRSNDTIAITPLSWRVELDVFVDAQDQPLSDHKAVAVRFAWTATQP